MSRRRPQMTPRKDKVSPRSARVSSGRSREASGSDLGRISEAFSSNLRARARAARYPPHSQSSCSRCSRHVGPFASWCLLVLCAGSSRRSLCFSPRVFRRCAQHVFAAFPGIEPESSEKDARETHGCASWCFALVLLAVVCARLLVLSVACDACGSRFSRASRSSIARYPFLGCFSGPLDFRRMQHSPHENLVF